MSAHYSATSLRIQSSSPSFARQLSAGSFSPGRDIARLSSHQTAGGFGRGHAAWVDEQPLPKPQGPPHVGKRDDLLRENKTLHREV